MHMSTSQGVELGRTPQERLLRSSKGIVLLYILSVPSLQELKECLESLGQDVLLSNVRVHVISDEGYARYPSRWKLLHVQRGLFKHLQGLLNLRHRRTNSSEELKGC